MVGTKRFKFDVFSNDVTLANEMESTGIAGRIHISEVTAKFLNNEYILEDGPDYAGIFYFYYICSFLLSNHHFKLSYLDYSF